ncbi:MAG: hypothetical protein ABW321_35620, partial [Polyangiales bacterium]
MTSTTLWTRRLIGGLTQSACLLACAQTPAGAPGSGGGAVTNYHQPAAQVKREPLTIHRTEKAD